MTGEDLTEVAELDRENVSGWAILHFEQQLTAPHSFHYTIRHEPDQTLYGFICGHCVAGEAEIHKIAVAHNHRRKNIGSTLLHHALRFSIKQQATSCFLELRASNTPARKLYRAFHFQTVGLRKKYYAHPSEDAIMMKLSPIPPDQKI